LRNAIACPFAEILRAVLEARASPPYGGGHCLYQAGSQ
jgi:hypothetical protein